MNDPATIETRGLHLWYGAFHALKNVNVRVRQGSITSLIGPSGCGKSTLLRCFNRMNERFGNVRTEGEVLVLGHDIYHEQVSLIELRKRVGMVFQRPNPLPVSVAENILFGLRLHSPAGTWSRSQMEEKLEEALSEVGLWEALRDRLGMRATGLTLEQQQKLCIARLLPLKPDVILMDEPCSALDADGTRAVEDLMRELAGRYTIVIVTHNMAQAQRVSEECVFMLLGEVVEHGATSTVFTGSSDERTRSYTAGRYG